MSKERNHQGKLGPDGKWVNPANGVPEEVIDWRPFNNGAKSKDRWWKHAFRMDRDTKQGQQICGSKLRRGLPDNHNVYKDSEGVERRRRCAVYEGLFPNGRCWRHGGAAETSAIALSRFVTHPVGPLGRAKERAEADRKLLDLRPVIALFDERLGELSERIESEGDTPGFRSTALRLFMEWEQSEKDEDKPMAKHFRKELKLHLQTGVRSDKAWSEILNTAERRGKRAERANLVLIKGHEVISKNEMQWALARMLDIISEEAHGAATTRIQSRIAREILGPLSPEEGRSTAPKESASLPGVPGEGVGVPAGGAGGETLEVSAMRDGAALPEREVFSEDEPRSGEDESGSGDSADVPEHTAGLDSNLDSPDGPPSEEPPVGGDREDAREGEDSSPW